LFYGGAIDFLWVCWSSATWLSRHWDGGTYFISRSEEAHIGRAITRFGIPAMIGILVFIFYKSSVQSYTFNITMIWR
jgi:hypothetical protein